MCSTRTIPRRTCTASADEASVRISRIFHSHRRSERPLPTKRILGVWLAMIAATACVVQEPFQPTANTLVVHAILDRTTRDQSVGVQAATGKLPDQRVVTGARVTIATPDGRTLVADEVRDSTSYLVSSDVPAVKTVYRVSLDL